MPTVNEGELTPGFVAAIGQPEARDTPDRRLSPTAPERSRRSHPTKQPLSTARMFH